MFTEKQIEYIRSYGIWKAAWDRREAAFAAGKMEEWRYERGRPALLANLNTSIAELQKQGVTQEQADGYLQVYPVAQDNSKGGQHHPMPGEKTKQ